MTAYVLATGNAHKVGELEAILGAYPVSLKSLKDFSPLESPVEDGETYRDNALIKARYFCHHLKQPCLADDSGLEVDALDGQPGVHSARFAGAETPHTEKVQRLLEMLKETPEENRSARFRCVAALVTPDGREVTVEAKVEGRIAFATAGAGGFGYDPIFFYPPKSCTMAELETDFKNEISHRALAFKGLMDKLGHHR